MGLESLLTGNAGSAIVGGATDLLSQGANMYFQNYWNKQSQKYGKEMYERQYNDNLALYEKQRNDNIDLWNLQNEYNSPSAQRQRLIDAGLNPAMMYGGSGGGGVSASTPQGATPQGANPMGAQFNAPQTNAVNFLNSIYALKYNKAAATKMESEAHQAAIKTRVDTVLEESMVALGIARSQKEIKEAYYGIQKGENEVLLLKANVKKANAEAEFSELNTALGKQGLTLNNAIWAKQLNAIFEKDELKLKDTLMLLISLIKN